MALLQRSYSSEGGGGCSGGSGPLTLAFGAGDGGEMDGCVGDRFD